MNVLTMERLMN